MKSVLALSAALAVATFGMAQAAEWPNLSATPSGEATVWDPGPQWPNVPTPASPERKPRVWEGEARWPSRPPRSEQTGQEPKWELEARWPDAPADDVTGSVGAPPRPWIASPVLPGFAFEIGARYWYSSGTVRFAFANGQPGAGNPTSTLDWNDSRGHSGEIFGRIDHRPTGIFVKGSIGAGELDGGTIIDRDFFAGQVKFSDTSSAINGDSLRSAMIDLGWSFDVPAAGVRLGGFVGYHYWRERFGASGLVCNADDVGGAVCGPAGAQTVPGTIAVFNYQPTWHALRVGFDARYQITPAWSVSGEVAFVPYAELENLDSHLLRQDMRDLGPAPNVITRSKAGWGGEVEAFINYAVHPNVQIGVGGRYWALAANAGGVRFGPDFIADYDLTRFEQQRFGLLVQVKGRF